MESTRSDPSDRGRAAINSLTGKVGNSDSRGTVIFPWLREASLGIKKFEVMTNKLDSSCRRKFDSSKCGSPQPQQRTKLTSYEIF